MQSLKRTALTILLLALTGLISPVGAIEVDQRALEQKVANYIQVHRHTFPAEASVSFQADQKQHIESKQVDDNAKFEIIIPGQNPLTARSITVLAKVNNQTRAAFTLRGTFVINLPVAFAANDIPKGSIIKPEDINLVESNIVGMRDPIFNDRDLYGKKTKRTIRMGQPMTSRSIYSPPTVTKGDIVTIRATSGNLIITLRGEAKQDGQVGDTIKVLNTSSRKVFYAEIVAPGILRIEL